MASLLTRVLLAMLSVAILGAQTYVRSVRGIVTGPEGKPIHGAIVQIEDLKTLQIRSFLSKRDGSYHFQELSTRQSYQLKAKYHGRTSSTQTLSKFNTENPAVVNLKIE